MDTGWGWRVVRQRFPRKEATAFLPAREFEPSAKAVRGFAKDMKRYARDFRDLARAATGDEGWSIDWNDLRVKARMQLDCRLGKSCRMCETADPAVVSCDPDSRLAVAEFRLHFPASRGGDPAARTAYRRAPGWPDGPEEEIDLGDGNSGTRRDVFERVMLGSDSSCGKAIRVVDELDAKLGAEAGGARCGDVYAAANAVDGAGELGIWVEWNYDSVAEMRNSVERIVHRWRNVHG